MRSLWAALAVVSLAACGGGGQSQPPVERKMPDLRVDDLRDNALGPNAAEPPWKELTQHTNFPVPGRALHPGASPKGDRVAYVTTEFGPKLQIAMKEADGAAVTRLSANAGHNLFPRISPDGLKVAWCSDRDGKGYDLFVARLDAPEAAVQVTFEPGDDIAPSWAPDGRRLVYCRSSGDGVWQVVVVDVGTRVRTHLGSGVYPDWSPDAKNPLIVFQSQPRETGGRSGLCVVKPDGRGLREIVGDKAGVFSAVQPRFSPNGRWIAYATVNRSPETRFFGHPDKADDLWIIRADGAYDTRLTDDLSSESWPSWGGERVFFISDRAGGASNVWSLRVKPLEDAE